MFCNKNNININDLEGLRETAKSLMSEKRFFHTLGVEEESVKIAEIYKLSEDIINKLRISAILHDITKEFEHEKQLEICGKYNIKLTGDDKKAKKLLHARTGAYIAKSEFSADDMIFDGIYNHTVSKLSKSFDLFNRIIVLADWIEPERDYQDCVELREYFHSKINKAENIEQKNKIMDETILLSYNKSIKCVVEENRFMHKDAIKCRNALIEKKVTV